MRTKLLPMKPAPPVTSMVSLIVCAYSFQACRQCAKGRPRRAVSFEQSSTEYAGRGAGRGNSADVEQGSTSGRSSRANSNHVQSPSHDGVKHRRSSCEASTSISAGASWRVEVGEPRWSSTTRSGPSLLRPRIVPGKVPSTRAVEPLGANDDCAVFERGLFPPPVWCGRTPRAAPWGRHLRTVVAGPMCRRRQNRCSIDNEAYARRLRRPAARCSRGHRVGSVGGRPRRFRRRRRRCIRRNGSRRSLPASRRSATPGSERSPSAEGRRRRAPEMRTTSLPSIPSRAGDEGHGGRVYALRPLSQASKTETMRSAVFAVPQVRDLPLDLVAPSSTGRTAAAIFCAIGTDEDIRALGDGDRALGVFADRDAGDAQRRRFLLQAARIGQDELALVNRGAGNRGTPSVPGPAGRPCAAKSEVASCVRRCAGGTRTRPGFLAPRLVDRAENPRQGFRIVHVRRAVQRQHAE